MWYPAQRLDVPGLLLAVPSQVEETPAQTGFDTTSSGPERVPNARSQYRAEDGTRERHAIGQDIVAPPLARGGVGGEGILIASA